MIKMVAIRRVKYPHGPTGREYDIGEGFEALSERDAKGLFVAGKAKPGEAENKTNPPKQVVKVEEVVAEPQSPLYKRRDMQAETGQTGADKSPPSSPAGRASRRSTSKS